MGLKNNVFVRMVYYRMLKVLNTVLGDELITKIKYKKEFGKKLDLKNPKTMNEKIEWLKLYDYKDEYTIIADKYRVREWLSKRYGESYLVPLIFVTENVQDINPTNIPDYPCIVKCNSGSAAYQIIRDKSKVNWPLLQKECQRWLDENYYYFSQEKQYKDVKPIIMVEKLLLTKNGTIPNDYKLNYFNGNLEFVYCSVDREGGNYRNIYDKDWKPLDFSWVHKSNYRDDLIGPAIPAPASFNEMVKIGNDIAKDFKYVRVDFYDVDGKLYYGEVTLHHGSGLDSFVPSKYDLIYGEKLML